MKLILRITLILSILVVIIGCDQISKNVARRYLTYNSPVDVINGKIILLKIENSGAFMSLGSNVPSSLKFVILTIIPFIGIAVATCYILLNTKLFNLHLLGCCFLIGGGIGNLYDRLIFGSVTDFIYVGLLNIRTGIFNLADIYIVIGTLITIFKIINR